MRKRLFAQPVIRQGARRPSGTSRFLEPLNPLGALASPFITNNGALIFVRQDNGVFIYSGNISGTGSLTEDVNNPNSGDSTLLGTNTYTGGTFIKGGGIILGDGATPGAGTIVGNVIFTNSLVNDTARTLTFNYPDDHTFSGNIVGADDID